MPDLCTMKSMEKAVIIYGPPGSGKSTQAELIARRGSHIHFDTGRYIKNLLSTPGADKDPVLRREKALVEKGILCTPSWILKNVEHAADAIAPSGNGIVFSGSPRTLYEAFGDKRQEGLLHMLSRTYGGKKNIAIIELVIPDAIGRKRNAARYTCSVCGLPRLGHATIRHCAFCGGKFIKRVDDKPGVMTKRLQEYHARTHPILARAKKEGYIIRRVNGVKKPFEVFHSIRKIVGI